MIRGTRVKLSNGDDIGCVLITSVTRTEGKICMVLWDDTRGLRYSWEREADLNIVYPEERNEHTQLRYQPNAFAE